MKLKNIRGDISAEELQGEIKSHFNDFSRFSCFVGVKDGAPVRTASGRISMPSITIAKIRLKESKPYCGNHPYECEVGGSNRKAKYLEGLDWVEFNDRLNDILDLYGVSADVSSSVCIIRKGRRRRVHYDGYWDVNQFEWNRDEDEEYYQDYCGLQAPNSWYPVGTPGIYERMLNA